MATVAVETWAPIELTQYSKERPLEIGEMVEPQNDEDSKTSFTDIKYTYKCLNYDGSDFSETHNAPLDLEVVNELPSEPTEEPSCAFAIETKVSVGLPRDGSYDKDRDYSLDFMCVKEIGKTRMIIYSSLLLQAIREVVKYYPSQNLLGDDVAIREPYGVLIHHHSELNDLKNHLENTITDESDASISEKCRHIQVLLDFLNSQFQRTILPAKKRLLKSPPTVIFTDLWYLLKPGTLSYFINDDIWLGCVIESVQYNEKSDDFKDHWEVIVCFQDVDFRSDITGGAPFTARIERFDGEKVVNSLPVFPRDFHDQQDNGERRASFQQRGALVVDIYWNRYKYVKYEGKFMNQTKKEYHGPIIAGICDDPDVEFLNHSWNFDWNSSSVENVKVSELPTQNSFVKPLSLRASQHSKTLLTDDHLFMMCPVMPAFALSTKTWELINVDWISDLEKPNTIPDANVNPENLRIIKALSDRQINTKVPWSADFIKNKGEGVVVLLHGPPGVGKTYTVETIAMNTGRPLISLTIADLGTKEESIEAQLTRWFSLAQKWRAILLLDEADIFLERREHKDISRNGIVSAFLRKMEYFGGLLFLTTNRVGHIDEAFISRVHVIICFEKLDPTKRKMIWKSFLDKLHAERKGKIRVTPQGQKFVLGDEMSAMDWNGREIRNALQTAIALAEYDIRENEYSTEEDEITVEGVHFKQVMDMSKSFRMYMDSIRKDTEEGRARVFYGRNDHFRVEDMSSLPNGQGRAMENRSLTNMAI